MEEVPLRTHLSRFGANETLFASGELDIATKPILERAVLRALDGQGGEFFLDLSGLTFMDSTGASALLELHNRVDSIGRRFVVTSPSPAVRQVLELLGLDQVLDVRPKLIPDTGDSTSAAV